MTDSVQRYYRAVAPSYGQTYTSDETDYPANAIRVALVRERLRALSLGHAKPYRVLDAGCGEGTPMALFQDDGHDVYGFDFVPAMVAAAAKKIRPHRVWVQDITARADISSIDAIACLGPLPHLTDGQQYAALKNLHETVRDGGRIFVELRNELFHLFTFNRYTAAFFEQYLLPNVHKSGVGGEIVEAVYHHLDLTKPPAPSEADTEYNNAFSRWNNPLTVEPLFTSTGWKVLHKHFYHFHAWPPMYEHLNPEGFRAASLKLEWPAPQDWRAMFLASAYVVEAEAV